MADILSRAAAVDYLMSQNVTEECAWDVARHLSPELLDLGELPALRHSAAELLVEHRRHLPLAHNCSARAARCGS